MRIYLFLDNGTILEGITVLYYYAFNLVLKFYVKTLLKFFKYTPLLSVLTQ